jgi:hypothetical protein
MNFFSKVANKYYTRIRPFTKQFIRYQSSEFRLLYGKPLSHHSEGGIPTLQRPGMGRVPRQEFIAG